MVSHTVRACKTRSAAIARRKKLFQPESQVIHEWVVQTASHYFRDQGFKTYSTSGKVPDMFITDSDGRFYAIEVLADTRRLHQTVAKKIEQYDKEDIDGLYIIVPQGHKTGLINEFAKSHVVFLSFGELEENEELYNK
jgi:hypothetical protein